MSIGVWRSVECVKGREREYEERKSKYSRKKGAEVLRVQDYSDSMEAKLSYWPPPPASAWLAGRRASGTRWT